MLVVIVMIIIVKGIMIVDNDLSSFGLLANQPAAQPDDAQSSHDDVRTSFRTRFSGV